MAVTGLALCLGTPSVIVPLTVLAVWPGCVVTAVMTVATVARAPKELPVKCALVRVPAAVAGCEKQRVVCVSDWLCWGWGAMFSGAGSLKMAVLGQSVHRQDPESAGTQTSQQFLCWPEVARPTLNMDLTPLSAGLGFTKGA